jgi:hypothetical protein
VRVGERKQGNRGSGRQSDKGLLVRRLRVGGRVRVGREGVVSGKPLGWQGQRRRAGEMI